VADGVSLRAGLSAKLKPAAAPIRASIPDAGWSVAKRPEGEARYRALRLWLERRRAIRRRWQADARALVQIDESEAYYAAPRRAARARADGLTGEFLHWTKVAAEVARISPGATMNLASVQAIVDKELRRNGKQ